MMDRYRGKYRSDSARLKNWDYGSPGYYYVTICTKNRKCYFGEVVTCNDPIEGNGCSTATAPWDGLCGGIAGTHDYASLPPAAHPSHGLDLKSAGTHDYASLPPAARPSHGLKSANVGAVVQLTPMGKVAYANWIDIPKHFPFVVLDEFIIMPNHIHGLLCFKKPGYRDRKINSFGPQSANLASVIRNYKSATKAHGTFHGIEFAWQSRYHDDVITSGRELGKIRTYIQNNPASWIKKNLNKKP